MLVGVILSIGLLVSAAGLGPDGLLIRTDVDDYQVSITIEGTNVDRLNEISSVKYYALQYPSTSLSKQVHCSREASYYADTAFEAFSYGPKIFQRANSEGEPIANAYVTRYTVGLPINSQFIRQTVNQGLSTEIEKKTGICIMIVLNDNENDFFGLRQIAGTSEATQTTTVRNIRPQIVLRRDEDNKVLEVNPVAHSQNTHQINHDRTAWRIQDDSSNPCVHSGGRIDAFPYKSRFIPLSPENHGTFVCIRVEDVQGNVSVQKVRLWYYTN